ncbi:MAG: hypothetical protein M5R36_10130 [Deltaproteobacteria bacterium]|nr:hypothetical protein [Deltaproteobacteria bacterium]
MNTFLDTLKTRVQAAVEALYAFERKTMLPLPVMLGGFVFLLIVLCLVLVLVFRPGEAGLPFDENFDGDGAASWPASGGAWEVRDGALVQLDATAADAAKMTPSAWVKARCTGSARRSATPKARRPARPAVG